MSTQPNETRTVIVERSSTGTIMLAIALLIALVGGVIMFNQYNSSEARKNNAIEHAANEVDKAADKAGDAIDDAAKSVKKEM
ncbi:hypothetical protein [Novosphingobium sp. KACC 22771]|uniref:hypothetical protein n=1 Tax=Novosphingobium sp. KACC 22771 TaxID=3025670 RepID=UPI0023650A99|nr:hypothetical protein [Novosphingobium sp. KACC 22771]WDF73427.1 hypothetical protein PQ467_05115 [Novosphingobium sp. KACC 22771]